MSWVTRSTSWMPRVATMACTTSACPSSGYVRSGLAEEPYPGRSSASTRRVGASRSTSPRQSHAQVGKPWTSTTGGPSGVPVAGDVQDPGRGACERFERPTGAPLPDGGGQGREGHEDPEKARWAMPGDPPRQRRRPGRRGDGRDAVDEAGDLDGPSSGEGDRAQHAPPARGWWSRPRAGRRPPPRPAGTRSGSPPGRARGRGPRAGRPPRAAPATTTARRPWSPRTPPRTGRVGTPPWRPR